MKYDNITAAKFIDRPNRFIANVEIGGIGERVHVKNTGRCRELLLPGSEVILTRSDNPERSTRYDLIAVKKDGLGWVNIDSQAPNRAVGEWLGSGESRFGRPGLIRHEFTYGSSRVDFYLEFGNRRILIEVKGCTLEVDGIGYFPDAPTKRGVKHLRELAGAIGAGYECYIAFVIQMPGVTEVLPNRASDPEFADALACASAAGVKLLRLPCEIAPDEMRICGCN